MHPAIRRFRPILIALAAVGVIATLVYGLCTLIVLQAGASAPDPATGRIHLYETTGRGGRIVARYVTETFHLTSTISGWTAAILLGAPLAAGLLLLLADTVRLFIPGRYERANRELARYRKTAGESVTEEGLRYVAQWRDFNRRRALPLLLIALLVPVVVFRLRPDLWFVFAWVFAFFGLIVWQRSFRCPRCAERYSGKWRTWFAPPFCTHCGLPEGSPPTTAVAPDFEEWKKGNQRV